MAWLRRSAFYAIFLSVTVIPYAFACLLWAPLPLHWRYRLTVGWPRLAIWGARVICGIRWQSRGAHNLPDEPGRAAVQAPVGLGNAVLPRPHAARSVLRLQARAAPRALLRLGPGAAAHDPHRPQQGARRLRASGARGPAARWTKAAGRCCSRGHARAAGPVGPLQDGRRAAGLAHRRAGHPHRAQCRRVLAPQRLRQAPGHDHRLHRARDRIPRASPPRNSTPACRPGSKARCACSNPGTVWPLTSSSCRSISARPTRRPERPPPARTPTRRPARPAPPRHAPAGSRARARPRRRRAFPTPCPDPLPPGARRREVATPQQPIGFVLLRSRRRSIGFVIADDGLRVTAPNWVTLVQVRRGRARKSALDTRQAARLACPQRAASP